MRALPRGSFSLILSALIVASAIVASTYIVASGNAPESTYYGCLFAGSLTQVSETPPASCGRGTQISWNAVGPQGAQGEPGDQGDRGEPGLLWQGDWNDETLYSPHDAVSHLGSSWVAIAENIDEEPAGASTSWQLLALRGVQGEQGPPGDDGSDGERGGPGLVWRGAWSGATAYSPHDAVSHLGSSWIAVVENTGAEPGDASPSWQLIASRGEQGPQGPQGQQGQQGDPAAVDVYEWTGATDEIAAGSWIDFWVCPAGYQVLNGGVKMDPPNMTFHTSYPDTRADGRRGWRTIYTLHATASVTPYLVCLP